MVINAGAVPLSASLSAICLRVLSSLDTAVLIKPTLTAVGTFVWVQSWMDGAVLIAGKFYRSKRRR